MPVGQGSTVEATMWPAGKPQGNLMSGSAQLSTDVKLMTETVSSTPIPMVTALELGELQQPDPLRPRLILCRSHGQTLWEMARKHGSTVTAIQQANGLQSEPEAQQMLLIPVM